MLHKASFLGLRSILLTEYFRVKLPKTFLAVNLSDAFTFQEKERHSSEGGDAVEKDPLDTTSTAEAFRAEAAESAVATSPPAEADQTKADDTGPGEAQPDAAEQVNLL